MLKSAAYRSLKAAPAKHAVAKVMVAGDEASQLSARQLLKGNANDRMIQYSDINFDAMFGRTFPISMVQ